MAERPTRQRACADTHSDRSVTIVGGGVHGVHLAIRLLDADVVDHDDLWIVEPSGLLGGFRRKCRQCGVETLRSPFVHHVARDPFSLRDFARGQGREGELYESDTGGDRPSTELFFDHADWVIDRYDLERSVVEARATGISDRGEAVTVETTAGRIESGWCLLAVGYGGTTSIPQWANDLPADAPVSHVWDPAFSREAIGETEHVGVVGGGITAAQLAATLARPSRTVTLFARSPFRVESLEASTEWMHFSGVVDELHDLPPASRQRQRRVEGARNDGAIPPYVFDRLRQSLRRSCVGLERSEITTATEAGGTLVVTCEDGSALCLDRLLCATGFGRPYDCALFRSLAETSLQTGYAGAPVLDDETLCWRRTDGSRSRILVSGAAAEQVLGPFARNIIGARRAGGLIVDHLTTQETGGIPA